MRGRRIVAVPSLTKLTLAPCGLGPRRDLTPVFADRLASLSPGPPVLVDRTETQSDFPPGRRQVVMILLRTSWSGLKPLAAHAHASREGVQLLDVVGLQVTAPGPTAPLAVGEGVVDVDRHRSGGDYAPG